jgi:hypothetical protein
MNQHFKPLVMLIADTYKKDLKEVSLDLLSVEALIGAYEFSKGNNKIDSNYFLLSAGKIINNYKNEVLIK